MDLAILERLIEGLDDVATPAGAPPANSLAARLRAICENDATFTRRFVPAHETDPRHGLPWLI